MTNEPVSLLFGSDFHFGDRHSNPWEMGTAFCETILPILESTDALFLNGDFFDDLVIFDSTVFDPVYETILRLFHLCEEKNITVRLLQGTWSHDRNQCKRFNSIHKNGKFTFDFKFVEGIYLEELTLKGRSLRFFYMQDNLPYKSSEDAVEALLEKMREKDWDSIDYGCMHGFFEFTFPRNISQANQVVFRKSQFPFVKKIIDVGHVHQYGVDGNIISNGSFDRLSHGEEIPKGCVLVEDYPDYYTAHFVENKYAAIFNTLEFDPDLDTEALRDQVTKHLSTLDTVRSITLRFVTHSAEQYEVLRAWMKSTHPDIRITRKKPSDKGSKPSMLSSSALIAKREKRIAPTRATIAAFIRQHIPASHPLAIETIDDYLERPG